MELSDVSSRGRFGPTPADHPSVGQPCRICDLPIEVGQVPSLVMTEPADAEEEAKRDAGRPYNSVAEVVHESCVYTDDE